MPVFGPYAHIGASKVKMECSQDFNIFDNPERGAVLVVPYTAAEAAYVACASLSSGPGPVSLSVRARAAAREFFIKGKREACTLGEPVSVMGTMREIPYTCPPPPALPGVAAPSTGLAAPVPASPSSRAPRS
jgi:hypothetical protein